MRIHNGDRNPNYRHGHCVFGRSRTQNSYHNMLTRCLNPNFHSYHRYGGRGITVCQEWLYSFENFLADMGERPPGRTLDRINPDGNYTPENCRWATYKEQRDNTNQVLSTSRAAIACRKYRAKKLSQAITHP